MQTNSIFRALQTFSYVCFTKIKSINLDHLIPYHERLEFFKQNGFECDCRLCELDKNDENYSNRQKIFETLGFSQEVVKDMRALSLENPRLTLILVEALVEALKVSYEGRSEMKVQLFSAMEALGQLYIKFQRWEKVLKLYKELWKLCSKYLL